MVCFAIEWKQILSEFIFLPKRFLVRIKSYWFACDHAAVRCRNHKPHLLLCELVQNKNSILLWNTSFCVSSNFCRELWKFAATEANNCSFLTRSYRTSDQPQINTRLHSSPSHEAFPREAESKECVILVDTRFFRFPLEWRTCTFFGFVHVKGSSVVPPSREPKFRTWNYAWCSPSRQSAFPSHANAAS